MTADEQQVVVVVQVLDTGKVDALVRCCVGAQVLQGAAVKERGWLDLDGEAYSGTAKQRLAAAEARCLRPHIPNEDA